MEMAAADIPSSLAAAVRGCSSLVAASMVPGETSKNWVKDFIRSTMEAHDLLEGRCDWTASISLPRSSRELALGVESSRLSVPLCSSANSSSSSGLSVAVTSLSNDLYARSFDSDPLSLSLSSLPCSTAGSCRVELVLKRDTRNSPRTALNATRLTFNTTCARNDFSVHHLLCDDGKTYNVSCRGLAEVVVAKCPNVTEVPTCDVLDGWSAAGERCHRVSYTRDNVTCSCELSGQRRRSLLASNQSSGQEGEVSVSYVSILSAVAGNFESTVLSAQDLNGSLVAKGWVSMVTVSTLLGAILLAMGWSHYADKQAEKIESIEKRAKRHSLIDSYLSKAREFLDHDYYENRFMKKAFIQDTGASIMQLAEESLPQILGSKSLTTKVKNEMKRHHRWLGVIFHYSPKLPRLLRVASLACNIIIMLFVQSLTYDLTKGDDGSCERYETEQSCLAPRSAYATGQSRCYWAQDPTINGGETGGSCHFVQPDNSAEVVIFVAIFSALISTPLALVADRIILAVLAAPTPKSSRVKKMKVAAAEFMERAESVVAGNPSPRRQSELRRAEKESQEISAIAVQKFDRLTQELKVYRASLTDAQRTELDGTRLLAFIFSMIFLFARAVGAR